MNQKNINGIKGFITANLKNIKVPIKEFLYYCFIYQDEFPDNKNINYKLPNLKRDWPKNGYVKGYAVAFNVYEKLKKAKNVNDMLPALEMYDYIKLAFNQNVESTLSSSIDDFFKIMTSPILSPAKLNVSRLAFVKVGKLASVLGLFLTSTSTGANADLKPEQVNFRILNKQKQQTFTNQKQETRQDNKNKKEKEKKKGNPLIPFGAGLGLGAGGAFPLILLLGGFLLFSGKDKKRKK